MKKKWFIRLFLAFTKLTGYLPAMLLFKPKVYREAGSKKLPKPCIIVSNHKSLLDFVLLLILFPFRTIHFLMAEVLYKKGKFFSFLLNSWGGIRVDRDDKNFSFVSDALEVLDNGGTVGVFPEARLPIAGKPWPFTPSTAFIALHTDAPIIPVYTDGNYGIFKRAKVCIGQPIYARDYLDASMTTQEQIDTLTKVLQEKVYALKDLPEKKEEGHHPFFHIRHLPMDMARLVCSVLPPIFRLRRRTPEGEKYRQKVKGGAIIAANHTSFADPFIVGVTFWRRRLHFLAAEAVMRNKCIAFLLRGVGAIKIDRAGADIEAISTCVKKLKQGYLLSVFPQGKITQSDDVETIKSGAVLMAVRANVPIIPIHIMPRKKWYKKREVIIGNPIDPKAFSNGKAPSVLHIKKISEALAAEMNRCKNANNL